MEKYTSKHQIGDVVYAVLEPVGKSLTHPVKEVTIDEVVVNEREQHNFRSDNEIVIRETYLGKYWQNDEWQSINLDYCDWFANKDDAKVKQAELREELKAERQQDLEDEAERERDNIIEKHKEILAEADRLGIELK
jgi:hypothetical protein